jgi:hypothetical protein
MVLLLIQEHIRGYLDLMTAALLQKSTSPFKYTL